MMNQQELLDLKNEIEEDKAKASELKGNNYWLHYKKIGAVLLQKKPIKK